MLAPNAGASGGVPYGHNQQGRPSCRRLHVNPPLRRKPGENARPWCGFAEIWPSRPDGSSHRSCRPCGIGRSTFKPLSCVAQLFRSRGVRRPVAQLPTARELALQSTRHRALLALPLDHSRSRRSPRGSVGSRHRALLAFPLDQPRSRWSRLSRWTNHGRDGAYKVCRPDTCTCTHNPRRSWGQDSSIFRCMRLGRVNYRRWVTRPPASNGGKPSCANKWLRAGTETSVDHRTTPPRY